MALSLNKPKLDNLASDIWKSAERLRGKFKSYEYQSVILPIIVIRRLECVLIDWRKKKAAEVLKNRPKLSEKELAKLVKELELNPKQCPFSNKTDWTLRKVYEEDHALLEENFRAYINGFSKNVDDTTVEAHRDDRVFLEGAYRGQVNGDIQTTYDARRRYDELADPKYTDTGGIFDIMAVTVIQTHLSLSA